MSVNESPRPLTINIIPAFDGQGVRRHGWSFATLDGRQLCISRQPLLDASRVLLAKGIDPETPIVTRHAGADFDAMISTIGTAAKWRVEEGNTVSPTFRRWMAYPAPRGQSPMRFNERPVPDTGDAAERIHDGDRVSP